MHKKYYFFITILILTAGFCVAYFTKTIHSATDNCCYHECNLTDPKYCAGNTVYQCQSNCDNDLYNDWCQAQDCSATGQICVNGECQTECVDNDGDDYDTCSPNDPGDTDGLPMDCDDSNKYIYPNAAETCDNNDNNCDGQTDEGCDDDNDGYCDNTMIFYNYPVDVCPNTNAVDGEAGDDCDDTDDNINPGQTEVCDNIDNDCNPGTIDGTGETAPNNSNQNGVCQGSVQVCAEGDWIDDYASIVGYEGVENICDDNKDNDCDGQGDCNDEDCADDPACAPTCIPDGCNGVCPSGCGEIEDPDCGCLDNGCCGINCIYPNDIDCLSTCGTNGCESGENCLNCSADCGICSAPCGDNVCDASCGETNEICPEDCPDTCPDDTCDVSGGECSSCPADCSLAECCGNGRCDINIGENYDNCPDDCQESTCSFPFIFPCFFSSAIAEEPIAMDVCYNECNLTDPKYCAGNTVYQCQSNCDNDLYNDWCQIQDCSATSQICVNGECQTECVDNDGDGYDTCDPGEPGGIDDLPMDCDDDNKYVYPGAVETCDNNDNNCDGQIDEGCDDDNDGYCDNTMIFYNYPVDVCPNTNVADGGTGDDCNDTDGNINPGQAEVCDNIDNDCNPGTIDGTGETAPNNSNQNGVCQGSVQVCAEGDWIDDYASIVGYEGVENICDDSKDNDCDGQGDCNDEDCANDPVCAPTCIPDGCNGVCPSGCGETEDPDCGCLDNGCCGINCIYLHDIDCLSTCGTNGCESGENCLNCSADCGICSAPCGDNVCDASCGETNEICPEDCPDTCPDDTCDVSGGECSSCPADCTLTECCGNGRCDINIGENYDNCPDDCQESTCSFPFIFPCFFSSAIAEEPIAMDVCYNECNLTDPKYCAGNTVYQCQSNCDNDLYNDWCQIQDCSVTSQICVSGECQTECVDNDYDDYDICNPNDSGDTDGLLADCDDANSNINPGASEICDNIDNDCNSDTQDGSGEIAPSNSNQNGVCQGSAQVCAGGAWTDNYFSIVGYERVENTCNDSKDNDCDGQEDCGDEDCADDPACAPTCIPDGCNGICPSNCTVVQDPDCGCRDDDDCCGIECGYVNDNNCVCIENWTCADWSDCASGKQIRICSDSNNCGTESNKPIEEQFCLAVMIEYPDDGYNFMQGEGGVGSGASFSAGVLGGAPPYSFLWNSDLAGDFSTEQWTYADIGGWSIGTHTITAIITDSLEEVGSDSIQIIVNPVGTLIANISMGDGAGGNGGELEFARDPKTEVYFYVNVNGGVSPYTFVWNSSIQGNFSTEQWSSINVSEWTLGVHTITVTITDDIGAIVTDTIDIKIVDMAVNMRCPGNYFQEEQMFDVLFETNVDGGTAPYTYLWQSDLDGVINSSGPKDEQWDWYERDDLSIGIHAITCAVTDADNLSVTKTIHIQILPLTLITVDIVLPEDNSIFQMGDYVYFDAIHTGGVWPDIYSWTSNIDGEFSTAKEFNKNNLSAGDHIITLTVSDSKGNSGSANINLTVTPPAPIAPVIDSPTDGSTFKRLDEVINFEGSATGGVVPYTYLWSSDIDGDFGAGYRVFKNDLSAGSHIITLIVIDAASTTATTDINITVSEGSPGDNIKDNSKYISQEAFLISDENWRDVLSLVPVTTWTSEETIIHYPTLIFHNEASSFDADSNIHFIQQYEPSHLTTIGAIPADLNNLLIAAPVTGAGLNTEDITNINPSDYFSYWTSYNNIVVVDYDNYKAGLMASVFASYKNSPIIFINSGNLSTYEAMINGKSIYIIGAIDSTTQAYINDNAGSQVDYTLEEVQQWYASVTNSNKLIFVNPNDLNIEYSYSYTPEKSNAISSMYSKMSLSAPFLAAARQEVIGFTELPDSGTNSGCSESQTITDNIIQADADAVYAIENLFTAGIEFFTVIASPRALPDSEYKSCHYSWHFRTVEDTKYSQLIDGSYSESDPKVGRIYGITVADASSYIARSLNFDYLNSKIYGGNYASISVGHSFSACSNYAKTIRDKTFDSGYNSICYTGEARENCTTGARPPYSYYEDKNYIAFLDHGGPYCWGSTMSYNQIPWLDMPVIVSSSCLTNNFWQYTAMNFGAHTIRRGAIAYKGSTGVTWTSSFYITEKAIQYLGEDSSITLGEMYEKSGYNHDYNLLGDPTLQPKFKPIAW